MKFTWYDILIQIASGGGLTIVVGFLCRNWIIEKISYSFNKKLEEFKIELNKDLEVLKATLAKQNINYQLTQQEFIRNRFERINSLYAVLKERYNNSTQSHFLLTAKTTMEISNARFADEKINTTINDEFTIARLYLDESLNTVIREFLGICHFRMIHLFGCTEIKLLLKNLKNNFNQSAEQIAEITDLQNKERLAFNDMNACTQQLINS